MTAVTLVTKPTCAESARRETVKIFRDLLAKAEAGDIAEVFVVVKHADGSWSGDKSAWTDTPATIGRIEMAKQDVIRAYMGSDD